MIDPGRFTHWRDLVLLILPSAVLFSPVSLAFWYRRKAFGNSSTHREAIWYGYRNQKHLIVLTMLASWWAVWDFNDGHASSLKIGPSWPLFGSLHDNRQLAFWISPLVSLFVTQLLNYSTDNIAAGLRWSKTARVRRAWWSVVQDGLSMLLVATGFEAIYRGSYSGFAWLLCASIVHRIGLVFLRLAAGMRFHRLKSGELRNRCLTMARKMGIEVRSVCMVPAGKGHLTNAYGGSGMIALTDALPQHLNDRQIDSVIAHELIHVKYKHPRQGSAVVVLTYLALAMFLFRIPVREMNLRPLLDFVVVFVPMIGFYYFSRRAEYEADRESVIHTGDADAAIRGLAKLYRCTSVPADWNGLTALFQTHPSLTKRVSAISKVCEFPEDRASKILAEAGLATEDH